MLSRQLTRVTTHTSQRKYATCILGTANTEDFPFCRQATARRKDRFRISWLPHPPPPKKSVTSESVCAFTLHQHYSGEATALASGWRMLTRGRKLFTAPVTETVFLLECCRTYCIFWWKRRFTSRVLQKSGSYRTRYLAACSRILPNTARICSNHSEVSWLSPEWTFDEVENFLS